MIHKERVTYLNDKNDKKGEYGIYWMQASHRTVQNHALEYAVLKANSVNVPLVVFFGLTEYPESNERHNTFMLEGLQSVERDLEKRGIPFIVKMVSPEKGVVQLAEHASFVVVDGAYQRVENQWRTYAACHCSCPVIQVETNVVVPVERASQKKEYSAATFRPKIMQDLEYWLAPLEQYPCDVPLRNEMESESLTIDEISFVGDRTVKKVGIKGGTHQAVMHLQHFLKNKLDLYAEYRNDPTKNYLSCMSPYLHFGQISPVFIASKVLETDSPGKNAYLEELIVRRELAINFVHYSPYYDSFEGLPDWPKKTLTAHIKDKKEYVYTREELEHAKTHDVYWNAAQKEMVSTGKMHGYMRMYWGKKILEWCESPASAFATAVYLNNKYELDGRDPNGFCGVAWCFGCHDRPWKERAIFGMVRYMNDKGLKRKFDADAYVEQVEMVCRGNHD